LKVAAWNTTKASRSLLKVCLVHPVDPPLLKQLRHDVDTMGDPRSAPVPAWAALSLSLYHLRSGNDEEALKACEMGLTIPDRKSSCEVSLLAVKAMAHVHRGEAEQASAALAKARELAEKCDGKDFSRSQPIRPRWFDWAFASLLISEAARVQG
jgi:hypothetical protein